MNTVLASPVPAKPNPAAVEFAAGTGLPVQLAVPRTVDGRFAIYTDRLAIVPVVLGTGATGFQVGAGLIFAERDAAVRYANTRRAKMARFASSN